MCYPIHPSAACVRDYFVILLLLLFLLLLLLLIIIFIIIIIIIKFLIVLQSITGFCIVFMPRQKT